MHKVRADANGAEMPKPQTSDIPQISKQMEGLNVGL